MWCFQSAAGLASDAAIRGSKVYEGLDQWFREQVTTGHEMKKRGSLTPPLVRLESKLSHPSQPLAAFPLFYVG